MRSYTHAFFGLVLGAMLITLAGCAQDDTTPPVHNKDLGTQQGEVLVPYETTINRKITLEPSQYPMPQMPALVTAEATGSQPTAEGDEYAVIAREIVNDLAKAGYDKIVARFDETMKNRLPEAQVQSTWEMLVNQAGAFQEITGVRREQAQIQGQTMEVAIAACKFERANVDVKVVLNPQKQVAGFFMVPAGSQGAEAAPAGQPAATPASAAPAPSAPAGTPRSSSGSTGNGMGELPPTAPAPVGLGN